MSHGQGDDSGSAVGYSTARGRDWPSVRQFNVFVENRVGNLLGVVRRFETTDIRIVSLTVVDSADCAVIRLVLSNPERATEIFERAGLPFTESDLLVVQLPEGSQPLLEICKALLGAEISIHEALGGERTMIGFRPETVVIGHDGPIPARIRLVEDLGSEVFVHLVVDHEGEERRIVAKVDPPFTGGPGENVRLALHGDVHLFDESEARRATIRL